MVLTGIRHDWHSNDILTLSEFSKKDTFRFTKSYISFQKEITFRFADYICLQLPAELPKATD